MIIEAAVARVRPEAAEELAELVEPGTVKLAWSSDLSLSEDFTAEVTKHLRSGTVIHASSLPSGLGADESRARHVSMLKVAKDLASLAEEWIPGLKGLASYPSTLIAWNDLEKVVEEGDEGKAYLKAAQLSVEWTKLLTVISGANPDTARQLRSIGLLVQLSEGLYSLVVKWNQDGTHETNSEQHDKG